ncbi:hypothetical protein I7I48_04949 [Histoplasma ohiense]|nr:hypothetical protein I7I48_04949 [Histoplasma ohiense (nom. inval.)]
MESARSIPRAIPNLKPKPSQPAILTGQAKKEFLPNFRVLLGGSGGWCARKKANLVCEMFAAEIRFQGR